MFSSYSITKVYDSIVPRVLLGKVHAVGRVMRELPQQHDRDLGSLIMISTSISVIICVIVLMNMILNNNTNSCITTKYGILVVLLPLSLLESALAW